VARTARGFVLLLSGGGMLIFAVNVAIYAAVGLVASGPTMLLARGILGDGIKAARFGMRLTWMLVGAIIVAGAVAQAWALNKRSTSGQPSESIGCLGVGMVIGAALVGGWIMSVLIVGAVSFGGGLWVGQIFDVAQGGQVANPWGPGPRDTMATIGTNAVFFACIAIAGMGMYGYLK